MLHPSVILDYWLGTRDEVMPDAARVVRWFVADGQVDQEIREQFESVVGEALAGGLQPWEADPRDRIALVLLVDQFPRNLYRNHPRGFSGDPRAIDLTRRSTEAELRSLHPLEQYFLLIPWMHTEHLDDQHAGEAAYAVAAESAPSAFRPLFENGRNFAASHRKVIERFGRFPHRNAILGRESTPEELAFLETYGTGF